MLATRSAGKLRELRALFAGAGVAVVGLDEAGIGVAADEDAVESFETFEENALAKARYFRGRLPGRVVVADDSGLEVRALRNAPGVRSRRWSGRVDIAGADLDAANNALLLERLRGVSDRRARFVCAAAYASGDREIVTVGEVEGSIVDAADGDEGFGYDPHFYSTELRLTLANASVSAKEGVSHRGRAFRALLARLSVGVRV